jgi:hypothetical protein
MRKFRRISFFILFIGGCCLLTWGFLRPHASDPVYQDKRLSVWLQIYYDCLSKNSIDPATTIPLKQAEDAIRHIGTNAAPLLLEMFTTRYSPLQKGIAALGKTLNLTGSLFQDQLTTHYIAYFGFIIVRADAQAAIPALVSSFYEEDGEERTLTIEILGSMGLAAADAAPMFIRWLHLNNYMDRVLVIDALSQIGACATNAVPVLIEQLETDDKDMRRDAIMGLGHLHLMPELVVPVLTNHLRASIEIKDEGLIQVNLIALKAFGKQASPAIPIILPLLNRPTNTSVYVTASRTLKRIDPKALPKSE